MLPDPWGRFLIGFGLWAALLIAIFVLVMIFPAPARSQGDRIETMCQAFATDTVLLAAALKGQPDEDQAHSLVAGSVPAEAWPTYHWMIRLIYREPPEKLREAALRECLKHHGKTAGITTVLGIRG